MKGVPTLNAAEICAALAAVCFVLAFPVAVNAGTIVVFYEGLCNSNDACKARQQAQQSIGANLPPDTKLITPDLTNGLFANSGTASQLAGSFGNNNIVLIAYSAGHKAMWQTVQAMNTEQMKRVKSLVSLEANYSGFDNSVARVRSVNPSVDVRRYSKEQFNTNHSNLPTGAGDELVKLTAAVNDGSPLDTSKLLTSFDFQPQQTPTNPSQFLTQLNPNTSPLSQLSQLFSNPNSQKSSRNSYTQPSYQQRYAQQYSSPYPVQYPESYSDNQQFRYEDSEDRAQISSPPAIDFSSISFEKSETLSALEAAVSEPADSGVATRAGTEDLPDIVVAAPAVSDVGVQTFSSEDQPSSFTSPDLARSSGGFVSGVANTTSALLQNLQNQLAAIVAQFRGLFPNQTAI